MAYPTAKKVPIPELGPEAWILVNNPWLLPVEDPLPAHLTGPDADPAAVFAERKRRGAAQMVQLIKDWGGITDIDGNVLPPPREDPTSCAKAPQAVVAKLAQACSAMDLDHEWDPTKRPGADAKTTVSPERNAPSESSPATSTTTETTSTATRR